MCLYLLAFPLSLFLSLSYRYTRHSRGHQTPAEPASGRLQLESNSAATGWICAAQEPDSIRVKRHVIDLIAFGLWTVSLIPHVVFPCVFVPTIPSSLSVSLQFVATGVAGAAREPAEDAARVDQWPDQAGATGPGRQRDRAPAQSLGLPARPPRALARPQPAATVAARDREPGQSRVSRCVREQVSYLAKKRRIQGIHGPEIKSFIY